MNQWHQLTPPQWFMSIYPGSELFTPCDLRYCQCWTRSFRGYIWPKYHTRHFTRVNIMSFNKWIWNISILWAHHNQPLFRLGVWKRINNLILFFLLGYTFMLVKGSLLISLSLEANGFRIVAAGTLALYCNMSSAAKMFTKSMMACRYSPTDVSTYSGNQTAVKGVACMGNYL